MHQVREVLERLWTLEVPCPPSVRPSGQSKLVWFELERGPSIDYYSIAKYSLRLKTNAVSLLGSGMMPPKRNSHTKQK